MPKIALVLLMGGFLVGASRCEPERAEDPGVDPGMGSSDPSEQGPRDAGSPGAGDGEPCGPVTCAEGDVCCNESCGICTEPGGFCTQQLCTELDGGAGVPVDAGPGTPSDAGVVPVRDAGPRSPVGDGGARDGGRPARGERCGSTVCAAGEVCCNASCGICTEPGGFCTQQLCDDRGPVRGPFCGGFAGFGCPGAGRCVDDPSDGCDPRRGGADCGGVCVCEVQGLCERGSVWNDSPEVCACEPDAASGGETCGDVTCPKGQVCCNASCGICTPPDGACIQIACS